MKESTYTNEGRGQAAAGACLPGYPETSRRFEWLVTAGSLWMIAGLYLDGWAHNNLPEQLETFFTPWHAVLYSGFAFVALVLVITYVGNIRRGYHWRRALPQVYMLSLLGVLIFGLAGNLDFLWHELFGFEEDVEALLSPSHLALASGGILIVSSALRDQLQNGDASRRPTGTALLSLFLVLSVVTFFTQFASLFAHPAVFAELPTQADTFYWDVTLIAHVLFPVGVLMGFMLFAMRRWQLPGGSLALMLGANALLMFLMNWDDSHAYWPILIGALLAALAAEGLYQRWLAGGQLKRQHAFNFLVATLYALLPMTALLLTVEIWWSVHMWLGVCLLAGFLGLGLSYLTDTTHGVQVSQ
jgi:hypothetical protein